MSDAYWYIVTVKGEAFTAIWKRRWIKISKDAYSWDDRNQAKDIAQALRKRYPSKSIRVASDKELAPWFVGEALEDKCEIIAMVAPWIPLLKAQINQPNPFLKGRK